VKQYILDLVSWFERKAKPVAELIKQTKPCTKEELDKLNKSVKV